MVFQGLDEMLHSQNAEMYFDFASNVTLHSVHWGMLLIKPLLVSPPLLLTRFEFYSLFSTNNSTL